MKRQRTFDKFQRPKPELTQERLRQLLEYDPETGHFRWLVARGPNAARGQIAGCTDGEGYVVIRVDLRIYKAHRLALFYLTGKWPEHEVDHRNGNPSDNRAANLRPATTAENCQNRKVPRTNTSGVPGVCWHKTNKKWLVTINKQHVGWFDCFADAVAARAEAKRKVHSFEPKQRGLAPAAPKVTA